MPYLLDMGTWLNLKETIESWDDLTKTMVQFVNRHAEVVASIDSKNHLTKWWQKKHGSFSAAITKKAINFKTAAQALEYYTKLAESGELRCPHKNPVTGQVCNEPVTVFYKPEPEWLEGFVKRTEETKRDMISWVDMALKNHPVYVWLSNEKGFGIFGASFIVYKAESVRPMDLDSPQKLWAHDGLYPVGYCPVCGYIKPKHFRPGDVCPNDGSPLVSRLVNANLLSKAKLPINFDTQDRARAFRIMTSMWLINSKAEKSGKETSLIWKFFLEKWSLHMARLITDKNLELIAAGHGAVFPGMSQEMRGLAIKNAKGFGRSEPAKYRDKYTFVIQISRSGALWEAYKALLAWSLRFIKLRLAIMKGSSDPIKDATRDVDKAPHKPEYVWALITDNSVAEYIYKDIIGLTGKALEDVLTETAYERKALSKWTYELAFKEAGMPMPGKEEE